MKLRIGTRGSFLALTQAKEAISAIKEKFDCGIELIIIKTTGDKNKEPLKDLINKTPVIGIFVKEIEEELLKNTLDIAVHSLKDLPTALPGDLSIGAVLKRSSPLDVLISAKYSWGNLPDNAVIGTGSMRRRVQAAKIKPGITFKDLRGNIDTRVNKIIKENLDGILCAQAALIRLNILNQSGVCANGAYSSYIFTPVPKEIMLPAAGQGTIALEYKQANTQVKEILSAVNHEKTFFETGAEREFLASIGGGCLVPAGALAQIKDNTVELEGFHANEDGGNFRREKLIYPLERISEIGRDLAGRIKG